MFRRVKFISVGDEVPSHMSIPAEDPRSSDGIPMENCLFGKGKRTC